MTDVQAAADTIDTTTMGDGSIPLCPHQGCGFKCCTFQQGNFIVLHPGELDAAKASGAGTDHLELLENYHGGHKVVCRAADTAICDGGYKPLDCASYPFFPTVNETTGAVEGTLKGAKCPLTTAIANFHRLWVEDQWRRLADTNAEVKPWLAKVALVGYETVDRPD